jgi:hypothetical protein
MTVQHLRVARPTDRLPEVVAFYQELFEFEVLASFEDHEGVDGVVVGRRGSDFHLEFTRQRNCGAETDWADVRRRPDAREIVPAP